MRLMDEQKVRWPLLSAIFIIVVGQTLSTALCAETGKPDDGLYGGKLGIVFRDVPKEPAILTGLIARTGPYGPWGGLYGIRGIFETSSGTWIGPVRGEGAGSGGEIRVEAKPGYAVGAIELKYDDRPHGLRLTFMRKKDGRLDPGDKYRSRWIGARSGEHEASLGGNGKAITGLSGRMANDLHALGVLQGEDPSKD